jgi:acetyl-CoA C-acetyltransferase
MRSEPVMFAGKDHVDAAAGRECVAALWRQAGITGPLDQTGVAGISGVSLRSRRVVFCDL